MEPMSFLHKYPHQSRSQLSEGGRSGGRADMLAVGSNAYYITAELYVAPCVTLVATNNPAVLMQHTSAASCQHTARYFVKAKPHGSLCAFSEIIL